MPFLFFFFFWTNERKRKTWAHISWKLAFTDKFWLVLDTTLCSPNSKIALRTRRTRSECLLHLITAYVLFWFISIASEHPTLELFLAEDYFTIKCLISPNLRGLFFKSLSTRHFTWTSLVVLFIAYSSTCEARDPIF